MRTESMRRAMMLTLFLGACAPAAMAQPPVAPQTAPTPQIVVGGTEEVEIAPDRAMLGFAVVTRAKTAAAAGGANARIQAEVLDTLKKLGIEAVQIRTQGVNISPEYEYPKDGGRPTVIGYQASNSIQVELRQIAQVGATIDAGLARGATNVGGLRFFASNTAEARREAMRKAVASVRADAEAIASAAGGTLGSLLEISVNPGNDARQGYDASPMVMMRAERADVTTPVEAGLIHVSVSLTARFAFVAR